MTNSVTMQEVPQGLYIAMQQVESYLKQSGIERSLLELVRLRASQINGCGYCTEMHHLEAEAAGASEKQLYGLSAWREMPFYSDQERAVLELTDQVTLLPQCDTPETLIQSLLKHFSKQQVADLTLAVAQANSWNRLAKTFGFAPGEYRVGMHD